MNIKEKFFKWKQWLHKKRETITRVITVTLTVALIGFVAWVGYSIYQLDLERAANDDKSKDKTSIKATSKYDYGEPGFQQVAENDKFILSADFTTAEIQIIEKDSGMVWYSNPQDRAEDKVATIVSRLSSQIHVNFLNVEEGIFVEFDNFGNSIKKGRMEHELVENGVKFTFGFPVANVYIPVQYTLCEDGFKAEVITSEIKGVGKNPYIVERISLLPFFGAGGLEDEGYLLIPDGAGSMIDFNNERQTKQSYSAPVYGTNITIEKTEEVSVREDIALPVFGAKCNDHAFLGVITNGDANSTISATTSKKDSNYNHIYSSAVLREWDILYKQDDALTTGNSYTIDYTDSLLDGENYTVRYFFMDGEKANYTGMSETYRNYLKSEGKLHESKLSDKKYMVVDLIGAVSIKKYVMGVKRPVVTAMTTYNQVVEIVDELKAAGVENLIVNYIGALDSGLNNKVYNKVSTESVLGTKKEFKAMVEHLKKEGVLLFLETNPVDIYENGNGLTENGDSVKTFFDQYAFQYKFDLDKGTPIEESRWHLIRPNTVVNVVTDFTKSAKTWDINNISLSRLGKILYSNYDEEDYFSRNSALKQWNQALKNVRDDANLLMVHGGNVYTTAYADVITDLADSHSNYDMQNRSVPFYQLVFQGNTVLTSGGINTTVDYEYAFLKAMETGSSLKFNLMYGDVSELVGTDYNTMVSYSYEFWKDVLIEKYLEMQKAAAQFAGQDIVHHEFLEDNVTLTVYETGALVVNYSNETYTYNGEAIEARNYLVLPGGAK
ncbi:MAG: hypothetical protein IKK11_03525 [Oscillospiraceae bacterium]|nr:hypothetical protein [Oscillospiraceae bacterium]